MERKTILVVDDSPVVLELTGSALESAGYKVVLRSRGEGTVAAVLQERPDLVLLDVNMPRMDGVKAASEILRIAPATMIVFLTVHDAPSVMQITERWSHGYVTKSAAGTELIPMLKRLIPSELPQKCSTKSRRTATH